MNLVVLALKLSHEVMRFNYKASLDSLLVSVDPVLILNPESAYPACPSPWGHPSSSMVCHPKPFGAILSEGLSRVTEDLEALSINEV
jgi:hypothetical protein